MSDGPAISDEQHAARIARIRAERAARGLPEFIENEAVYRLLAAILTTNSQRVRQNS